VLKPKNYTHIAPASCTVCFQRESIASKLFSQLSYYASLSSNSKSFASLAAHSNPEAVPHCSTGHSTHLHHLNFALSNFLLLECESSPVLIQLIL
jgi:hypothetical protein